MAFLHRIYSEFAIIVVYSVFTYSHNMGSGCVFISAEDTCTSETCLNCSQLHPISLKQCFCDQQSTLLEQVF